MTKELTNLFVFSSPKQKLLSSEELKENVIADLLDNKLDNKDVRELLNLVSRRLEQSVENPGDEKFVIFEGFDNFDYYSYMPHEIEHFYRFARMQLLKMMLAIALAAKQNIPLLLLGKYKLSTNGQVIDCVNNKTADIRDKIDNLQKSINEILQQLGNWKIPATKNSIEVYAAVKNHSQEFYFSSYPHIKIINLDNVVKIKDCYLLCLGNVNYAMQNAINALRIKKSMEFINSKEFLTELVNELSSQPIKIEALDSKTEKYKAVLKICHNVVNDLSDVWEEFNKIIESKIQTLKLTNIETYNKVTHVIMDLPFASFSIASFIKELLKINNLCYLSEEINMPINYTSFESAFIKCIPSGVNSLFYILENNFDNFECALITNESTNVHCHKSSIKEPEKNVHMALLSNKIISRSKIEHIKVQAVARDGLDSYYFIAPSNVIVSPVKIKLNKIQNNNLKQMLFGKNKSVKIGYDEPIVNKPNDKTYSKIDLTKQLLYEFNDNAKEFVNEFLSTGNIDKNKIKNVPKQKIYSWLSKLDYLASSMYDFVTYSNENDFYISTFLYSNGQKIEKTDSVLNSNIEDITFDYNGSNKNIDYDILDLSADFASGSDIEKALNIYNSNDINEEIENILSDWEASINEYFCLYSKNLVKIALEKQLKFVLNSDKQKLDSVLTDFYDYTFCESLSSFSSLLTSKLNSETKSMTDYDNVLINIVTNDKSAYETIMTECEKICKKHKNDKFTKSVSNREYVFITSYSIEPIIRYMQVSSKGDELENFESLNKSGLALALSKLFSYKSQKDVLSDISLNIISRQMPEDNYIFNYLSGYTRFQVILMYYLLHMIYKIAKENNFEDIELNNYQNLHNIFKLLSCHQSAKIKCLKQ